MITDKQIEDYYIKNRSKMCKRVKRMCKSPENAEDVVQETFFCMLRSKETYKDPWDEVDKWVNTILINEVRRFCRIENNQGMSLTDQEVAEIFEDADKHPIELRDYIIKHKHHNILDLHFRLGYKPKELELLVDKTADNINKIIQRFRNDMKSRRWA